MNPTKLLTSDEQAAAISRSLQPEASNGRVSGTSNYAVTALNLMQATNTPQEQMLAAQAPVMALALEGDPSADKAIKREIAAAKPHQDKHRGYDRRIKQSLTENVSAEYRRSYTEAAFRADKGDVNALDGLEGEAEISSRYEAELAALHHAKQVSAHAILKHALAIKPLLDSALGKLAAKYEAEDIQRCRAFGITPTWSDTTRLVQSVRLQLLFRTADLRPRRESELVSPSVAPTYADFLPELSSW